MTLPTSQPAGIDALSRADACPGCHWRKRSALSMAPLRRTERAPTLRGVLARSRLPPRAPSARCQREAIHHGRIFYARRQLAKLLREAGVDALYCAARNSLDTYS